MVEGVVRQQPPIILAPKSRHLVAWNPKSSSWKHLDGCQWKEILEHNYTDMQKMSFNRKVNVFQIGLDALQSAAL